MTMKRLGWVLGLSALLLPITAQAVDLDAVGDIWLREVAPDTTYENDWVSVWSSTSGEGARRYGVIEWDVSSLAGQPLLDASISLWSADDFSGTSYPVKMGGSVIDTSGGTAAIGLTWNTLNSEHPGLGTPLETLGRYDVGAPNDDPDNLLGKYVADGGASTADLAAIEAAANSASGLLTVLFIADEDETRYQGDWGDGANAGGPGYRNEFPGFLIVEIAGPPCRITTSSLPDGTVGTPYAASLETDGNCTGTLQWGLATCNLPPGLSLDPETGAISGTPILGGSYEFVLQLTADEGERTRTLSIDVNGPDADFDNDGDVDLVDFDLLALAFGGTQTRTICGSLQFDSTDTPRDVPDGGATQSVVSVPAGFNVGDVNVRVDVAHGFQGDVKVQLTSPQGTTVLLKNFSTTVGGPFTERTYDDEGAVTPAEPLSAFDGQAAAGDWTLTVSDFDASFIDNGVLRSWTLIFEAE